MSMEVQEQSQDMDEDRQHPKGRMPRRLKKVERGGKELNYDQQMQKVPPVLLLDNDPNDYDPMVVALGPYHHGKQNLQRAENFKSEALRYIIADTGKSVQFFFDEVFERVNVVRSYYTEDSTKEFTDSTFAQMMLLDTCFIISYVLAPRNPRFASTLLREFGIGKHSGIILRDLFLLENQIPFWFLKLVMYLGYGEKADGLLDEFIYKFADFSRSKRKQIYSYNPDSHLLEACWRVLLSDFEENKRSVHPRCKFIFAWHKRIYALLRRLKTCGIKEKSHGDDDEYTWKGQVAPWFYSAFDLKAKGIHFNPSGDNSLTGIYFKSGYHCPQLQLPILLVSKNTKVFLSNLIAYESFLESPTERKVTAYIKFMKLLIVRADDVKELREKGILFTSLGSDEEVAKIFKELSTSIPSFERTFENVRIEIQKHICSKFKSRLGEFLYIYFGTPWTAIGAIAAVIFLS